MAADPWAPPRTLLEEERTAEGGLERTLTVFLTGRECVFSCVFCDLWRHALPHPTPLGALPQQLRLALAAHAADELERIKLYNASNFFDAAAVPPADEPRLAALLEPFRRTVVECHPRLVGRRCFEFAAALAGRLEVAMGLETVHPTALPRLGKGMELEDFDAAAAALARHDIALRAFVLVGAPFVPAEEAVEWVVRSAAYAVDRGAERVVLIPVRGHSRLEGLQRAGDWSPPDLELLEECLERCLALGSAVVSVDLWDFGRFAACRRCAAGRRERLERINRSGRTEPRVACRCGGTGAAAQRAPTPESGRAASPRSSA